MGDLLSASFTENDENSGIYPYNTYMHPFTHLKKPENMPPAMSQMWLTHLQRLLVPSIMPAGLDPHQIITERNRYIDARIENRIRELSSLLSTMGEGGLEDLLVGKMRMQLRKRRISRRRHSTRSPRSPRRLRMHLKSCARSLSSRCSVCARSCAPCAPRPSSAERTALCYLSIERTSAGRGAPHCATRQGEAP